MAVGTQEIRAHVQDALGSVGERHLTVDVVDVNHHPLVLVLQPQDGALVGDEVVFELRISDPQDEASDLWVEVHSHLDGYVCSAAGEADGSARCTGSLRTRGMHRILVDVTDTDGNTRVEALSVER